MLSKHSTTEDSATEATPQLFKIILKF
jgi:hypothetical protein